MPVDAGRWRGREGCSELAGGYHGLVSVPIRLVYHFQWAWDAYSSLNVSKLGDLLTHAQLQDSGVDHIKQLQVNHSLATSRAHIQFSTLQADVWYDETQ
jgi:hypothetical protein